MIYIYDKKTKKGEFENNGLGKLNEAIKAEITQELNGEYSLYLEYPVKSKKALYLEHFNIIKANNQLFRIYKVEKKQDNNKIIMVWAKHIFYDLAFYFIEDERAVQCSIKTAMEKALVDELASTYIVDSDILINNTLYMVELNPVEAIFKIIERWGTGELYRDNYNIKILKQIGKETGMLIKYGKNIRGIKVTSDTTDLATKIYPKGFNGITLAEKYITIPNFDSSMYPPFHIIKAVEFKDAADEPTLRIMAKEYAKTKGFANVNIEVDFIEISKSKEYENFKGLQQVNLGDYVLVKYEEFDIDVMVEVIKIKQDLLSGWNTKVELGQPKTRGQSDFTAMISTVRDELGNKVAQALTSMLYYANSQEVIVSTTEVQPIYLGITAVSSTNLSVNLSISCNASTASTLTIKILLDNLEVPFKPKQKLEQGDNIIGIPLGIPQVGPGNHYIGISLKTDSGTVTVPIYNLQCMIDGRNLQGGMSAEPPHAEVVENINIINPSQILEEYQTGITINEVIRASAVQEVIVTDTNIGNVESDVTIELI
ncbi:MULTISPECIES: phage tail spike protein [unclassified Clostridium]|uniref:phage tail spike protein n=1 Tax=unclassified Clostridium TaxID=2614128 RepID=UPI003217599E